jgi:hypothetical protein
VRVDRLLLVALAGAVAGGCGGADFEAPERTSAALRDCGEPVGLSLRVRNGQLAPIALYGSAERYLQEIDITEAVPSVSDQGITPLIQSSAFSALNWSGVHQVEEVWVPSLDGTFTRERYFRGAKWMEQPSQLEVTALDSHGSARGSRWVARAGRDDRQTSSDSAFVRRFVARQSAFGCASVGDCSGASFVAEGLVQLRDALNPGRDAHAVPATATSLKLTFSQLPFASYTAPLTQTPEGPNGLGYGFGVELSPVSTPANGQYYVAGEAVTLRVTFRDGTGHRLHPQGQLPSYADYVSGQVSSGLRYLDLGEQTRLYYALKHRESNLLAMLSGPTDKLTTPQTVVDPFLFFGPQVPFATAGVDGYTAIGQTVPPAGVIFGGLGNPALWATPVSDLLTFSLPADAAAGTYVAAIKARREFGGEALNRGTTLDIQVGQSAATSFSAKTTCGSCHQERERTGFDRILHGIGDRRACFGCHASLGIEFDNAIDIRVHTIHDRSDRFAGDVSRCSTCHLTPPSGPARGVLP